MVINEIKRSHWVPSASVVLEVQSAEFSKPRTDGWPSWSTVPVRNGRTDKIIHLSDYNPKSLLLNAEYVEFY